MPLEIEGLDALLKQHLNWYPLMELHDIYKLLYQGAMGSEHLISSPEEFAQRLRSEFDHLRPDPMERIFEPVRPNQTLLRLNLRAYKSRQTWIDPLISPLLETARSFTGDLAELRATWNGFIQSCELGQIQNYKINEIHTFTAWLEKLDFPAVHHSEIYCREYQPAYLLISDRFVHQLGLDDAD